MKKISLTLLTTAILLIACSKTNDTAPGATPQETTVEYHIAPITDDLFMSSISYTGADGKPAEIQVYTELVNGSKKIQFTGDHFPLSFKTTASSFTSENINFTMSITVNGKTVATKNCKAMPNASSQFELEYDFE